MNRESSALLSQVCCKVFVHSVLVVSTVQVTASSRSFLMHAVTYTSSFCRREQVGLAWGMPARHDLYNRSAPPPAQPWWLYFH